MPGLLRRRIREEDLLLFNRLKALKLKIMEQPGCVKEGGLGEIVTGAAAAADNNNDTVIYLETSPEEGACSNDEKFFMRRPDPHFEVSNLIVGMKLKIGYITSLLKGDPALYDMNKVIDELNKLSSKCDEIEKLAGMDISWCE